MQKPIREGNATEAENICFMAAKRQSKSKNNIK